MSKNTVERTSGGNVITMHADPTKAIAKGEGCILSADYTASPFTDQNTPAVGVALEAHASGVYEDIPVLVGGPVIRVTAGTAGVAYGNVVNAENGNGGAWIVDTSDPAGVALETATVGNDFDMIFNGSPSN